MIETMQIDGIAMRWEETGDGPPVVLIHGIPTSPALWRDVVPRLDSGRALAWEMVGFGGSWPEGRGRDISMAAQADYLLRWMDALDLRRPVLVGHDLGGGVAQIAATRQPDRVAGLVLSNAICYDSWPIPSVKAMRAMGPLVERTPPGAFRLNLAMFIRRGHERQDVARRSAELHLEHYSHPEGPAAFIRQARSLRTNDTLEIASQLQGLRMPAALVWGAADRFQKIGYGRRLARDLGASLDEVKDGKHFVPEDHPDRMAAAVKQVLDRARV